MSKCQKKGIFQSRIDNILPRVNSITYEEENAYIARGKLWKENIMKYW